MKKWMIEYRFTILGLIIGAVAGYLYWLWVGCDSGTCKITSDPLNSTLYFSVMGGLLFSGFGKQDAKKDQEPVP